MAGLATLLREAAMMGIGVAIRALAERKTDKARLLVRSRRMAFFAGHLGVQAGERIPGLGVVEGFSYTLPVAVVVALQAVLAQAAAVRVLVASDTGRQKPEVGAIQVFYLDERPLGCRNVFGTVTAVAAQPGMFAFERIASLFMVEGLWIPLNEWEIPPVVFGMAAAALLAGTRGNAVGRMQSALGRQAIGDFGVAIEATKNRLPAELVAACTLRRPIQ